MSQAEVDAFYQTLPMVGRCLFCPDWIAEGSAEEVRRFQEAHRRLEHPNLQRLKRRHRPRRSGVISFRQSLTDEESEEIERQRAMRMKLLGQA